LGRLSYLPPLLLLLLLLLLLSGWCTLPLPHPSCRLLTICIALPLNSGRPPPVPLTSLAITCHLVLQLNYLSSGHGLL
jgi:hypothetical protein